MDMESGSLTKRIGKRACLIGVLVSSVLVYGCFAFLLSLAWFKGDDYLYATHDVFSLSHVYGAIHTYLTRVSRVGEIVAFFLGLMSSRWQHWVFTPFFLVALPFTLVRLVKVRCTYTSGRFLLAFWFIVFLALQSVHTNGYWRSYWCFTASTNYFWSTVVTFVFLPLLFPWKWGDDMHHTGWRKRLGILLAFSLGVYSGWGTEAMTVTLLPLLTCWMLYLWVKEKRIPMKSWFGYLGFCLGAFFLFASPALARRALEGAVSRTLDVAALTSDEISAFVQTLTPEKLKLLVDGCGCVNLGGIPMLERIYFLPFLAEVYWSCCEYPTWVLIALIGLTLIFRPADWKKNLLIAGGMYAISWVCAISYLGGAIPGVTSFLPPSFIVMSACVLLFVNLRGRFYMPMLTVVTVVVSITGLQLLVPPTMEAYHYKKYEKEKFAEIERQKAVGIKHVVLYRTWPAPPRDALGMICSMELGANPKGYPNSCARHYYGVEAISQMSEIRCPGPEETETKEPDLGFELEK